MNLLTTTLAALLCAVPLTHAGAQGSPSAFVSLPSSELMPGEANVLVFQVRNTAIVSRQFRLASETPGGWTITRSPSIATIAAGATQDFTLTVTPAPFGEPVPITFSLLYEEPGPVPGIPPTVYLVESTTINFTSLVPFSYLFQRHPDPGPWAETRLVATGVAAGGYGYFGGGIGGGLQANASAWRSRNGLDWEQIVAGENGLPIPPFQTTPAIGNLAFLDGVAYVMADTGFGEGFLYESASGADWSPVGVRVRLGINAQSATLVGFAGRIWLLGGEQSQWPYAPNAALRSWAPGESEWRMDLETAPYTTRLVPLVAPTATRLFMVGGTSPGSSGYRTDVWSTTNGTDWQQLAAALPDFRTSFGIGALDDTLYLAGGQLGLGNTALGDLWTLNLADGQWSQVSATAFPGRANPTLLVLPQRTLLLGGVDLANPAASDSIWYLDTPIPVTETGWIVE